MQTTNQITDRQKWILLLVSSLGYFVDAFDLVLFSVVRSKSIVALKLAEADNKDLIKTIGLGLENTQALGLLLGGIIWGVFGDRIGRIRVLYGSIALYSIANLLNGFIYDTTPNALFFYTVLRFVSGFGLAGELGSAVTLISEVMSKEKRGIGTMIIAGIGLLGCVAAAGLAEFTTLDWHTLFLMGGFAGLILLLLRAGVADSTLFLQQKEEGVPRGSFFALFTSWSRFSRLLQCVLIGLPVYFVVGLPVKFSTNFGAAFGIQEKISVPLAIMMCYIFLSLGDFVCNGLSQYFKSRRALFFAFNILNLFAVLAFVYFPPTTVTQYLYIYCPILGFSVGYWAMIVTNAAEQFGTNLRSTVANIVPNFIRAAFIPISLLFAYLEPNLGTIHAAGLIGVVCSILALVATYFSKETFGTNLDFIEQN